VRLLYGNGLGLMELLPLRVEDSDLERRQLAVRGGKGDTDRVTMVPESLVEVLRVHLVTRKQVHNADLADGYAGRVLGVPPREKLAPIPRSVLGGGKSHSAAGSIVFQQITMAGGRR
jgi:integrase